MRATSTFTLAVDVLARALERGFPAFPVGGGAGASFSWSDNGADSYQVGWDTISHAGEDVNDPTIYPNRLDVGTALSWTNNTGQTVYASVRSVVDEEIGPWSATEQQLSP
jgi:hypothetical protein